MFKRWLIRGVLVGLLLLCVGGWGWSVNRYAAIRYYHGEQGFTWGTGCSSVYVAVGKAPAPVQDGFNWRVDSSLSTILWSNFRFYSVGGGHYYILHVPYWFLILVFSFALLYVWRKTRPTPTPSTACSVETSKGGSSRWLIRGVLLFLLALCVVGWGWSVTNQGILRYSKGGYQGGCNIYGGVVHLTWCYDGTPSEGWNWSGDSIKPCFLNFDNTHILGFQLGKYNFGPPVWLWVVGIPFWFLILLFSLALFIVWRKTRPKPSPATAFPVEVIGGRGR